MKRALILALPLVLAVAACGDDDDDDSPDTTATATETSVATDDTSTDDTTDDLDRRRRSTDDTDDARSRAARPARWHARSPGGTLLPGGSLPIDAEDIVRQVVPEPRRRPGQLPRRRTSAADIDPTRRAGRSSTSATSSSATSQPG